VLVLHSSEEQAEYTRQHFGCQALSAGYTINRWASVKQKMIDYIQFVRAARRTIKTIECDVIFGISLINSMAAVSKKNAMKRIMYVDFMSHFFHYAYPSGIRNRFLFKLGNLMEHYTLRKADQVVMITKALKQLVNKKYHHKILVIPDGADTQHVTPNCDPTVMRKKYHFEEATVIGYQGGIEPHDGLQFLAEAAPQIIREKPDIRFLIAGRGSYLEKVKNMVKANGTESHWVFTGWVDFKKIPLLMAATDLNVIPIPNHPAMRGIITFRLLESMAAGASIIASDLPGIREIADETMVYFTTPEKITQFAQDILNILNADPDTLQQKRSNARKQLERLDWRDIAKRDADFLEGKL
jgi:glycosyltransferase involved in cell wall biosynthesis